MFIRLLQCVVGGDGAQLADGEVDLGGLERLETRPPRELSEEITEKRGKINTNRSRRGEESYLSVALLGKALEEVPGVVLTGRGAALLDQPVDEAHGATVFNGIGSGWALGEALCEQVAHAVLRDDVERTKAGGGKGHGRRKRTSKEKEEDANLVIRAHLCVVVEVLGVLLLRFPVELVDPELEHREVGRPDVVVELGGAEGEAALTEEEEERAGMRFLLGGGGRDLQGGRGEEKEIEKEGEWEWE